jgi:hypothetical protein
MHKTCFLAHKPSISPSISYNFEDRRCHFLERAFWTSGNLAATVVAVSSIVADAKVSTRTTVVTRNVGESKMMVGESTHNEMWMKNILRVMNSCRCN